MRATIIAAGVWAVTDNALASNGLNDPPAIQSLAFGLFLLAMVAIVSVFGWVGSSTVDPANLDIKTAYKLRRKLFLVASGVALLVLVLTLPRTPYANWIDSPDRVVYVATKQFGFFFSSEPITSDEELARIPYTNNIEVRAGGLVEFRVTGLDVNHGFGVYSPDGKIITQTQGMPGYVNRLRMRFPRAGNYMVLCLEYCGAAHHGMRTAIVVR